MPTAAVLFCLRAAASRAARAAKRTTDRYYRAQGLLTAPALAIRYQGVLRICRRAEVLRYTYLDAAWEACLQPVASQGKEVSTNG